MEGKDMAKYFYTENSNHISNLTTTVQKRRQRSVAKISTIPPPLRGTTTKWLILDYYEIANQIDETGASSAETTKTPLNNSVPESTVVVAEYIQIECESLNVILNAISRLNVSLVNTVRPIRVERKTGIVAKLKV